eukprot:jgi/Picre1/35734/NNA_003194.t1
MSRNRLVQQLLLPRHAGWFQTEVALNNLEQRSAYSTQLAIRGADSLRAGSGGRSSVSGVTATIFGCSGFVGRYVAQSLGAMGTRLVLPYRCDCGCAASQGEGDLGMIVPLKEFNIKNEDAVKRAVEGSDLVINLLGADAETWNYSFEDVHVKAVETLAKAVEDKGVGEEVVQGEIGSMSTIFKPAPISGPEDRLFQKLRFQIKKMPFVPLVDGGKQKVQPIWIRDVALAVSNALQTYDSVGKTYHLAGPDVYSMAELADFSFKTIRESPNTMSIPLSDAVEETAMDLTYDAANATLKASDLDVVPHKVTEGIPIEFLRHYRAGGYDMGSMSADGSVVSVQVPPKHQFD